MNNRFKFRTWDNTYKKYRNGLAFQDNQVCTYDDNVCVLEQCTGLRDKNGKLIYEGDIVTCGDDRKWVIIWDDSFWQVKEIRQDCCININALTWCNCEELEVIGNIHENPELLEQSNDD